MSSSKNSGTPEPDGDANTVSDLQTLSALLFLARHKQTRDQRRGEPLKKDTTHHDDETMTAKHVPKEPEAVKSQLEDTTHSDDETAATKDTPTESEAVSSQPKDTMPAVEEQEQEQLFPEPYKDGTLAGWKAWQADQRAKFEAELPWALETAEAERLKEVAELEASRARVGESSQSKNRKKNNHNRRPGKKAKEVSSSADKVAK
ncbi:hypothetical protein OQA88_10011 [Cercophora sp. LCS_1]